MNNKLSGKTALITGGSSGIGKAIVTAFAREGARVAFTYNSSPDKADEIERMIKEEGGEIAAIHADVSKEDHVLSLFDKVTEAYNSIDVLVCSAGIQNDNRLVDMTLRNWQQVIDINLTGYFLCAREASKKFLAQKNDSAQKAIGNIIFISSVHDIIPWAEHVNYAASKGGVLMLMKSIAQELAPHKIRVNAISPGAIKTDINKEIWSDETGLKNLLKLIPYGRIGETEDVANVALWLGGTDSDYVTGTTIYVDGGMTLYPGFSNNG